MKKIILILFGIILAYSNSILNVSYKNNNQSIDILFSLDKPFKGKISIIGENSYKITGLTFNRVEQKRFKNGVNIIISQIGKDSVNIRIVYNQKLSLKAAILSKGYILKLSIHGIKNIKKQPQIAQETDNNSYIFYIIIAIAFVIILVLILYRKQKKPQTKKGYKVLYEKHIDNKNKVVMIEVFKKRYLILMGENNNLLLDNFEINKINDINQIDLDNLVAEKLNEDEFIKKASKLKDINEIQL